MVDEAFEKGYDETNAESKVCQDLLLMSISKSRYSKNVTIKGGVLMRCLTNDYRRSTQDIDLDFIRYSLDDDSIDRFVSELNLVGLVYVKRVGQIEELR